MTRPSGQAPPIDLLSPHSYAGQQPHDQFSWLRDNDPAHWHDDPAGRGFWVLTRFDDVKMVGRNPATFSSAPTIRIADPHPD
ncbi:MAG: cytochrome P450, partial [Actinomycetota bacterium]|nr:cytochrome P450 [Actinomycetota bacterium]